MLTATQEILIYEESSEEPRPVLWGDFRDSFGGETEWLAAVERALLEQARWERGGDGGPPGVIRIELSQRWQI